ncbi:MAG: FHA domain-containing protein [Actinomycetia bacterium]|nr:FHA domain-containing protein [Actinomycetes bacterium]
MDETKKCPVCKADVAAESQVCERCGFRLIGITEPLGPLEIAAGEEADAEQVCGSPHLTLIKGPLKGEVFYLEVFPVTIGRDPSCDIFLNNMTVSRQHAIMERQAGQVVVRDNQSLNGTWVNGKVADEAVLADGSLLQIGTFAMRFNCN